MAASALGSIRSLMGIKMHSCPSRKKHPGILEICPENGDLELSGLHLRGDGGPSAGLGKRLFQALKAQLQTGLRCTDPAQQGFFFGGGGGGGAGGWPVGTCRPASALVSGASSAKSALAASSASQVLQHSL